MQAFMQQESAIPARESARLSALFDASLCPMEYGLGRDKSRLSVTRFARVSLAGIDVMLDQGSGRRAATRTHRHVAAQHTDDFLLCLPHRAEVTLAQSGAPLQFGVGSFALLSTARPFSALIEAERGDAVFSHTIVRIPGPRLRARAPGIDDCCGTPIALRAGIGRIMAAQFELALQEGSALDEADASRFGEMLIDAVAAATRAAPELTARRTNAMAPARERLRERAGQLILSRLSDPALTADDIARECGVSVRYLRAAFAEAGISVGGFTRTARLRECRNALRDPALHARSIMDIAMRWGFNDAAHFSRVYRREFDIAPSDERRRAALQCAK